MEDELRKFINRLKNNKNLDLDEAKIKQGIIIPLLRLLGWDDSNIDEVCPEYTIIESKEKVDYSLRISGFNKVFLEVKKVEKELEDFREQLLRYCFKEDVEIAILTDGIKWEFYLPLKTDEKWSDRLFYYIDCENQETEKIASKFTDFLSKKNIESGEALKNAEEMLERKQILSLSWSKIIEESNNEYHDFFIELMIEVAEQIYGYKPDKDSVEKFLSSMKKNSNINNTSSSSYLETLDYTHHKIQSFRFKGNKYKVSSWRELLLKLSEILSKEQGSNFNKVLNLKGKKRYYFSKNPKDLKAAKKIKGTDVYVETNLSAKGIDTLCKNLLALFNYKGNELKYDLESKTWKSTALTLLRQKLLVSYSFQKIHFTTPYRWLCYIIVVRVLHMTPGEIMPFSIRLPKYIEERLDNLSKLTGRSKSTT